MVCKMKMVDRGTEYLCLLKFLVTEVRERRNEWNRRASWTMKFAKYRQLQSC